MFGLGKGRDRMKREIVINSEYLETRVSVLENGQLEEFQVEHPTEQRIVGSIFKGKIQNLENELQAAFVDIGLKKNAFLHYWDMIPDDATRLEVEEGGSGGGGSGGGGNRGGGKGGRGRRQRQPRRKRYSNEEIAKRFPPGSEIVVQVTKAAIGTKGPRVTASLSIPGRYLVMMPGSKLKGVSRKIGDAKERQRLKKALDRLPVPADCGLIVRTVASGANKRSFVRDLRGLTVAWTELQTAMAEKPAPCCIYEEPDLVERVVRDWLTEDVDRVIVDNREKFASLRKIAANISRRARSKIYLYEGELPILEHYDVERQVEEAFKRQVSLKSGGAIIFDETEALIAIDVNTGRHKGKGSQEEVIFAVNTEAVNEVARQLRLRNVGGLVVIDLIDMKSRKHQNAVYRTMKAALKRDRARTNLLAISELGLMEMTRQRAEQSILSSMVIDCPYCHGRGTVRSPLGMSVEMQRQLSAVMRRYRGRNEIPDLQIVVHPTVLERIRREDEAFLVELESRFKGRLVFKSDPSRHVEFFAILNAATNEVLYSRLES
ncbi:MAG: Rne/Rng family ribonuclease [Verrucomicrobia bacterium]|jgi:ribonuclease G|nr:Rne/Rng family ribonuclease [Verrucomicrobiota bacterium]